MVPLLAGYFKKNEAAPTSLVYTSMPLHNDY